MKTAGVRVSGGELRGRRVRVPEGARPTTQRVREALFSRWAPRIVGARFLDLWCGSGIVSFEALSRGARGAWLVDSDPKAITRIRGNAEELGRKDDFKTLHREIDTRWVADFDARGPGPFDLAFADPPYDELPTKELLRALCGLVVRAGEVCLECSCRADLGADVEDAACDDRRYGETRLLFFAGTAGTS